MTVQMPALRSDGDLIRDKSGKSVSRIMISTAKADDGMTALRQLDDPETSGSGEIIESTFARAHRRRPWSTDLARH